MAFYAAASIFLACYVSTLITKNQGFSELVTILVAIILPLIGEIAYFKYYKFKGLQFIIYYGNSYNIADICASTPLGGILRIYYIRDFYELAISPINTRF